MTPDLKELLITDVEAHNRRYDSYVDPTSKYYIDRLWEEYHKVKKDLTVAHRDASSAWQDYHKMKEELAATKSKLGQLEDYVNEVLKPELADAKIKLKMAQSAWDELDKSHAERAKLHDELIIAEGQRDDAVAALRSEKETESFTRWTLTRERDQARAERDALKAEVDTLRAQHAPPRVLPVVCAECKGIGYLTVHSLSANGGTVTTHRCSCNVSPLLINATADFWSDTR